MQDPSSAVGAMARDWAVRTASLQALVDETALVVQTPKQQGYRRLVTYQLQEDVESYRAASKRSETTTYADTLGPNTAPGVYGNRLFEWTLSRLDRSQLRTNRMVKGHFQYLLPTPNTSKKHLAIFDALHYRPMTVSNHDLSKILNMELSTATSPMTLIGVHFYTRAWTLTPDELRAILAEMTESGSTHEEMEEWQKVLDLYHPTTPDPDEDMESSSSISSQQSSLPQSQQAAVQRGQDAVEIIENASSQAPEFLTVRYVGKVSGPRRPYDRYIEDLTTRTSGVLHEFAQVIDRLFPAVADAAQVHLLKDASLDLAGDANRTNADDVERFLIEYFD